MKYSKDNFEELLEAEGIVPVTVYVGTEKVISYDNSGSGQDFTRFWCYVCMKNYATYEEREKCRHSHTPEEEANPKQMQR